MSTVVTLDRSSPVPVDCEGIVTGGLGDVAKAALTPLVARGSELCAIVAKNGEVSNLDDILASHPRMHTCEGFFYRDVLREACAIPAHIVLPASLDVSKVGKLAAAPWGRDQKLAALAAWSVMGKARL